MIFGQILDACISDNLELQKSAADKKGLKNLIYWLQEFCTINLNYGRGTGKTTAMCRRASSKDLILTRDRFVKKQIKEKCVFRPTVITFEDISRRDLMIDVLRGKSFDRIWVDDAMFTLNEKRLQDIYYIGCFFQSKQIILIG